MNLCMRKHSKPQPSIQQKSNEIYKTINSNYLMSISILDTRFDIFSDIRLLFACKLIPDALLITIHVLIILTFDS